MTTSLNLQTTDPMSTASSPETEANLTGTDINNSNISEELHETFIIYNIFSPILIIVGTAGNTLTIAVMTRSTLRNSVSSVFFIALAFSDLCGLYVGLCSRWIAGLLKQRSILEKGNFMCKVLPWITYTVLDFSSWILVAVTIERVIATCFPLRAKSLCTKNFAFGYIVASGTILLAINAHMLQGFEFVEEGTFFFCDETPESYKHFFNRVWPWIDITIYCLLPFIFICVGNLIILTQVKHSHRLISQSHSFSSDHRIHTTSTLTRVVNQRFSSLTKTIILINTLFLVSTFPICIVTLAEINLTIDYQIPTLGLWHAVTYNFMFLNNAINVFIYLHRGSRYRKELKTLYRQKIRLFQSWYSKQTPCSNTENRGNLFSAVTHTLGDLQSWSMDSQHREKSKTLETQI